MIQLFQKEYMKIEGEWLTITVPASCNGKRLDYLVKEEWPLSKQLVKMLIREDGIKLNGKKTTIQQTVTTNDCVQLHLLLEEENDVLPNEHIKNFSICYEDDFLLVVNKGAGLDVHPNEPHERQTLANGIAAYYQKTNQQHKVRHVHRLDRDTTGLVLFAKDPFTQSLLDEQLRLRFIHRQYYALVHGKMKKEKGIIDQPIGKDRHYPNRRVISKKGARAITEYDVVETYRKASMVKAILQTGRTHQIRVHFQSIGHPLIGDPLYGKQSPLRFTRQALHAKKLTFTHPFTLEKMTVECEFPTDFRKLKEQIKQA